MRTLLLSAFALLALFLMSPFALAETLEQRVAHELSGSQVYIDPSIPDSAAKAARLSQRLKADDQIVIAILPGGASNPDSFARQLSVLMPDKTVTVAVGQTTVAIAGANWPDQVTADSILDQDTHVASDVTDRLVRFVTDIHAWQDQHPKPLPPAPPKPPADLSGLWEGVGGTAAVVAIVGGGAFVVKRRNARMKELYGAPRRYRGALKKILSYRDTFGRNSEVGRMLTEICELSVKYFRCNNKEDAAILHYFLRTNLPEFLRDYRQACESEYIQDRDILESSKDALGAFREFVGDIVRKNAVINTDNLKRNMEILRDARNSTTLP